MEQPIEANLFIKRSLHILFSYILVNFVFSSIFLSFSIMETIYTSSVLILLYIIIFLSSYFYIGYQFDIFSKSLLVNLLSVASIPIVGITLWLCSYIQFYRQAFIYDFFSWITHFSYNFWWIPINEYLQSTLMLSEKYFSYLGLWASIIPAITIYFGKIIKLKSLKESK